MDDKIDWKGLLKYALPMIVAAGVGVRVIQRQKRLEEFEVKYMKPLREEETIWIAAIANINGALSSLDSYEENYNPSKKGPLTARDNKGSSAANTLVYKHKPEPDKARGLLGEAIKVLGTAKPTVADDKTEIIGKLEEICNELGPTANCTFAQKKILEVANRSKKVRSDYSDKISAMEKKKNTYVKLLS